MPRQKQQALRPGAALLEVIHAGGHLRVGGLAPYMGDQLPNLHFERLGLRAHHALVGLVSHLGQLQRCGPRAGPRVHGRHRRPLVEHSLVEQGDVGQRGGVLE